MSRIVGEEEAGAEAETSSLESYLDQRGFEFELEAAQIRSSGGDAGGSRERERQGLLFPSLRRCFEPSRWEGDEALIYLVKDVSATHLQSPPQNPSHNGPSNILLKNIDQHFTKKMFFQKIELTLF